MNTVVIHPDYCHLEEFIRSVPNRFASGEGTVIYKGRNELRTMEHEGRKYVVKRFHLPKLFNRIVYGTFRPSKAQRSYEYALQFLRIGVGTPQPIAWMARQDGLLFGDSYYVSALSACTHVYYELFERHFDYEEDVMRAIGRTTAVMHNGGYTHKDYGRGNILFERMPDGGILVEVVDLNRMHTGPIDIKAGCRNFERLPATPEMHRLMAEEYARLRGFDAKECQRLMAAYRSTQRGLIDDKY